MGFIGNLNFTELVVIAAAAVMIFGRNLPRVIAELLTHLMRAKRALREMWRETGIEDEMRKVQHDLRRAQASLPTRIDPASIAREAAARWVKDEPGDAGPKPDAPDAPDAPDGDGTDREKSA